MPTLRIVIETAVAGHFTSVLARFDQSLFEQLSPPGAGVELKRFDGSRKGDVVHIRLSLLGLIKQDWISEITEDDTTESEAYFIDQGSTLPFFLSYWQHRHIVRAAGADRAIIVDDIRFRTPFFLLDYLMYPILWAQFAYRRPIYRRVFGA